MAIKGWNQGTEQFSYKTKIYNPDNKQWLTNKEGKSLKPLMLDAVNYFIQKIMTVHLDSKTGMVTVSVDFYSPAVAQQWATLLIAELNDEIRQQDMLDAHNRIEYLNQQLTKTNIADSRKMLYQLIEQQTKTLMLTNVSKEYIFRTIDPAVKNLAPIKPKKRLIIVVAVLMGLITGIMFVFIRSYLRE
ncbi:GNVR domain-containing protein [Vibrio sp. PP-XX7]